MIPILISAISSVKVDIKPKTPFLKNKDTENKDTGNKDTYITNRTITNRTNINSFNINSHSFYQEQENLNKTNSLLESIYFHF